MMKDKLVKTGHKKAYYIYRNIAIVLICAFSIGITVGVPTYISVRTARLESGHAEQTTSENISNESSLSYDSSLDNND